MGVCYFFLSCLFSGILFQMYISPVSKITPFASCVFSRDTADAKDSEVVKKVRRVWVVHSTEKLEYVWLKIAGMKMFLFGEKWKNLLNKMISS